MERRTLIILIVIAAGIPLILILLSVIGGLAYFGILNPSTLIPERCELQMGFYCNDYFVETTREGAGRVSLTIENGRGSDNVIDSIQITSDSGVDCSKSFGITLRNGESDEFIIDDCRIPFSLTKEKEMPRFDIILNWFAAGSSADFMHTLEGQLMTKVES